MASRLLRDVEEAKAREAQSHKHQKQLEERLESSLRARKSTEERLEVTQQRLAKFEAQMSESRQRMHKQRAQLEATLIRGSRGLSAPLALGSFAEWVRQAPDESLECVMESLASMQQQVCL